MSPALFSMILIVGALSANETPTIDALRIEAAIERIQSRDPWSADLARIDRAIDDHTRLVASWKRRSSPPSLDLGWLGLPIDLLVDEAYQRVEFEKSSPPRPRMGMGGVDTRPTSGPLLALFEAIASHEDSRRIAALVEFRSIAEEPQPPLGQPEQWASLQTHAATLEWAVAQIRTGAESDAPLNRISPQTSLTYRLVDRFAGDLPADVSTRAYDFLVGPTTGGPSNGDRIWDLLIRVDPTRARREVISYFRGRTSRAYNFDIYVVQLLRQHPGPSRELAEAVRGWLDDPKIDPDHRRDLRVILLLADPAAELAPTLARIEADLVRSAGTGVAIAPSSETSHLIGVLSKVGSNEADKALARFVFDHRVPEMDRLLALESLARRGFADTAELVERWLAEESEVSRIYLRRVGLDWGQATRKAILGPDRGKASKE